MYEPNWRCGVTVCDIVAPAAGTAPLIVGIVHRRFRLASDDVLVRDEAAGVEVRGVHLVGEHVVIPDKEVWLGLGVRHVTVRRVLVRAARLTGVPAVVRFVVEAVHQTVRAGIAPGSVAGGVERVRAMVEIPARVEPDRLELDLFILRVVSVLRRVGSGKAVEEIVEAAVLLNDDDHVANLRARWMTVQRVEEGARARLRGSKPAAAARGEKRHDEGGKPPKSRRRPTAHRGCDGSLSDA